jgi:hypothetical protein
MADQWTPNRWDIPLTPDEQREADLLEQQAKRLQEANTAAATRAAVQEIQAQKAAEQAVLDSVPKPVEEPVPDPEARSVELAGADESVDLDTLTLAQLRTLAREAHLSQAGAKKDLIARLEAARS